MIFSDKKHSTVKQLPLYIPTLKELLLSKLFVYSCVLGVFGKTPNLGMIYLYFQVPQQHLV